jgi:hypothetical protein
MYRHAIKYFDLSSFLYKRCNRITRLKHKKSKKNLLLIARNEKQKYSDKDVPQ